VTGKISMPFAEPNVIKTCMALRLGATASTKWNALKPTSFSHTLLNRGTL